MPADEKSTDRDLLISIIANHNYIFDVALGFRAAAAALGRTSSIVLLGYDLGEQHVLARRNCDLLGMCRRNLDLNALIVILSQVSPTEVEQHFNLVADEQASVSTVETMTLSVAQQHLAHIFANEPLLRDADLITCGYPYPVCYMLDAVASARGKDVLLPLHGTIVSEYIDVRLQPWVYRTIRAWVHGVPAGVAEEPGNDGRRYVFALNHIEHAWLQRTFGNVPFLPQPGRHLRLLLESSLGATTLKHMEQRPGRRAAGARQVLIYRLFYALPSPDARVFTSLARDVARRAGGGVNFLEFLRGHELWELLNFDAIVFVPWDWEVVTFWELYGLPRPLFLPDARFMETLIWYSLRVPEIRKRQRFIRFRREWWHGAPCHVQPACNNVSEDPEQSLSLPPWLDLEHDSLTVLEQISQWYARTDYEVLPHTLRFKGLPDLVHQLQTFDAAAIIASMQQERAVAMKKSDVIYQSLLSVL